VAIDTGLVDGEWHVFTHGGRQSTPLRTVDWAVEAARLGAGELLLTSMAHDGTKGGFAVELTRQVGQAAAIPIIASGGAGTLQHFADVFTRGEADAALAASIFHFGEVPILELKRFLQAQHIPIRWN
jgi:cyclase